MRISDIRLERYYYEALADWIIEAFEEEWGHEIPTILNDHDDDCDCWHCEVFGFWLLDPSSMSEDQQKYLKKLIKCEADDREVVQQERLFGC